MNRTVEHSSEGAKLRRFVVVPAAYLILENSKGKILLSKRHNTGYQDGRYGLVAGHIESLEKPTDAMIREAAEEIGIIIAPEDLSPVHMMYRYNVGVLDYFFRATKWEGVITNQEPEKCSELRFCDARDFPEEMIPHVQEAIRYARAGIPFSEFFDQNEHVHAALLPAGTAI